MFQLLALLAVIVGAVAVFGVSWWLERVLGWLGLRFVIGGAILLVVAVLGFARGDRLLPLLFVVQATGFYYHARWLRSTAEEGGIGSQVSQVRPES